MGKQKAIQNLHGFLKNEKKVPDYANVVYTEQMWVNKKLSRIDMVFLRKNKKGSGLRSNKKMDSKEVQKQIIANLSRIQILLKSSDD
jgi:hypothetical protein